jgi:hypothetical protein
MGQREMMETKFLEEQTTICGMVAVTAVTAVTAVAGGNLDIGGVRGEGAC